MNTSGRFTKLWKFQNLRFENLKSGDKSLNMQKGSKKQKWKEWSKESKRVKEAKVESLKSKKREKKSLKVFKGGNEQKVQRIV